MIEILIATVLLFSIAVPAAVHEKAELEKRPRTWKGEMLQPPAKERKR
jgi:hypothetical protein